ncbi:hypothetical protein AB0C59_28260 [Streptomyces sp. NPDC048664]|uniref:hypothetical protein n=1 Tax=Streptomyces sp. NPDC048664 TaxID=3154505 RepID=UPI003441E6A1
MAVLGTVSGFLDSVLAPGVYRSAVTLFVSVRGGGDAYHLAQSSAFTRDRVRSYAAAATGPQVTGPVVEALRLPMTGEQLARRITAEAPDGTVLVRLTVTDSQAARAALIGNALAERFARVVARMERSGGFADSPVRLTVLQPATVPSAPVSPDLAVNTALALAVSLLVGAALALVRERLRSPLRDTEALATCLAASGGPAVLAGIASGPGAGRRPAGPDGDPHGPRADGFRRLRVNLRFVTGPAAAHGPGNGAGATAARRPRVIAVTSPLPREGRSGVALGLAAALAEEGARVCLVDGDLRRPSLARTLGLAGEAGLTDALLGGGAPRELPRPTGSFAVLTSGALPPDPARLLGGAGLRSLLRELAEEFEHVIVDTSPVLPYADTAALAGAVDGCLLVARAGHTGEGRLTEALAVLGRMDVPVLGAVLNGVPTRHVPYGHQRGRAARRAPLSPARAW